MKKIIYYREGDIYSTGEHFRFLFRPFLPPVDTST